jgi:hypothetical protein
MTEFGLAGSKCGCPQQLLLPPSSSRGTALATVHEVPGCTQGGSLQCTVTCTATPPHAQCQHIVQYHSGRKRHAKLLFRQQQTKNPNYVLKGFSEVKPSCTDSVCFHAVVLPAGWTPKLQSLAFSLTRRCMHRPQPQ